MKPLHPLLLHARNIATFAVHLLFSSHLPSSGSFFLLHSANTQGGERGQTQVATLRVPSSLPNHLCGLWVEEGGKNGAERRIIAWHGRRPGAKNKLRHPQHLMPPPDGFVGINVGCSSGKLRLTPAQSAGNQLKK